MRRSIMTEKELITQCRADMEKVLEELEKDPGNAEAVFRKYALDPSGKIRREAGEWLGKQGRRYYDKTKNFLVRNMDQEEVNIRWTVVIALGELGSKDYLPVLSFIRKLSDDPDWTVRESAAGALISIHQKTPSALKELYPWCDDPSENVRRTLAESLGRGVGKKHPELTFELLERLVGDPSLYVRKAVANSCRNMSKYDAELVLEHLASWRSIDDENAQWTVADATRSLANRDPGKAMPLLSELARDDRKSVQRNVISVLREASKYNKDVIAGYMNEMKHSPDDNSIQVARSVLEFIGQ